MMIAKNSLNLNCNLFNLNDHSNLYYLLVYLMTDLHLIAIYVYAAGVQQGYYKFEHEKNTFSRRFETFQQLFLTEP